METILSNCRVVNRTDEFYGTVVLEGGLIKEVDEHRSYVAGAIDLEGNFLLPGLIEMHTDNLEKYIQPRPKVIWPSMMSAILAHDTQVVGAGITTVYDAVAVGGLRKSSLRSKILSQSVEVINSADKAGLLKVDHFLHLRCEISDPHMENMLNTVSDMNKIRLVSLMDHTPGQKQWRDLQKWRDYHRGEQWSDAEAATVLRELQEFQRLYSEKHRRLALAFAQEHKIPMASHDDTTVEDTEVSAADGIRISEFPTTLDAARRAQELDMKTIMGAPNAIRGQSHSGNVSAAELAVEGLLDGLSSDYVPNSLLHSAFHLADILTIPLPEMVAKVTANVADMVGLEDRGEIAPGKKADLLQVRRIESLPVIRKVWKSGIQVF